MGDNPKIADMGPGGGEGLGSNSKKTKMRTKDKGDVREWTNPG